MVCAIRSIGFVTQWANPPLTKDLLTRLKFALGRDEEILPIFIEALTLTDETDDILDRRIQLYASDTN